MIEFRQVVKRFGEREILKGLSFQVKKGEILFILGTSGTGKSVSLKCLVGLLRPEEGEIYFDGERIDQFSEIEYLGIRKRCGMVFQHPALFDSLSIYENIAFGLRKHFNYTEEEIRNRVLESLKSVHLTENILELLPQSISYGMQKRVSLARTLAVGPEVLLFDEPTTGLDPVTTNAINHLIDELSKKLKVTSIVVSHDIQCAIDIADHVIVLDQGKIVEEGDVPHLMASQQSLVRDFLEEVRNV